MSDSVRETVQIQRDDTWITPNPGEIRPEVYDLIHQKKMIGQTSGQLTYEGQTYRWSVGPNPSDKPPPV